MTNECIAFLIDLGEFAIGAALAMLALIAGLLFAGVLILTAIAVVGAVAAVLI